MVKYLPYLKIDVNVEETKFGFNTIKGLDSLFVGFQARDKVLCKSDIIQSMTDIFEEETVTKYREIIYSIVTGYVQDADTLSGLLTALYADDEKFKEYVATMFYLEEEETPFGVQLVQSLVQKVRAIETKWKSHFKRYGCKVFLSANCCIYYAVDDANITITLPEDCECEVLSNAKVWKGNTTRQRRD